MKLPERSIFFNDDAQQIDRTKFITSSMIAAIMGKSEYTSKTDVFYSMFGIQEEFKGNRATWLGKSLEPSLAYMAQDNIAKRLDVDINTIDAELNKRFYHPNGLYSAEVDMWLTDYNENIELKTAGLINTFYNKYNEWGLGYDFKKGNQLDDAIPDGYVFQSQFSMMCTGADAVNIQALIGGGVGDRYYYVERSDRLCKIIDTECQLFWEEVLKYKSALEKGNISIQEVRSPFKDSLASVGTLREMPKTEYKGILIDDEHWHEYEQLSSQTKLLKDALDNKKLELKNLLGDAEFAVTTYGNFTHYASKKGVRTLRQKPLN